MRFQAGGLKDISRWLSDTVATPPDCGWFYFASRRDARGVGCACLASLQDAVFFYHGFRWCRSLRDLNHRLISCKPSACLAQRNGGCFND